MTLSCALVSLGWISRNTSLQKGLLSSGIGLVESPSLDVFKNYLNVVLRDMV